MKLSDSSYNLRGFNILIPFFKIETCFCSVSTFLRSNNVFLYVFCRKIEYILDHISRVWVQKVCNFFFDFPNNTFPIETGIINLFHYVWGT